MRVFPLSVGSNIKSSRAPRARVLRTSLARLARLSNTEYIVFHGDELLLRDTRLSARNKKPAIGTPCRAMRGLVTLSDTCGTCLPARGSVNHLEGFPRSRFLTYQDTTKREAQALRRQPGNAGRSHYPDRPYPIEGCHQHRPSSTNAPSLQWPPA